MALEEQKFIFAVKLEVPGHSGSEGNSFGIGTHGFVYHDSRFRNLQDKGVWDDTPFTANR